ncbi:hypothetical protein AR685_17505 [Chryseobacterium sp. JAH]|nr:hypothetical protein AR685_17505 [Chryseobacterium sp. JAH]
MNHFYAVNHKRFIVDIYIFTITNSHKQKLDSIVKNEFNLFYNFIFFMVISEEILLKNGAVIQQFKAEQTIF